MSKPERIKIDEVEYVRQDTVSEPAEKLDGLDYVIVRTRSAGVFAGWLQKKHIMEVTLIRARRLWYWSGAASLSQLAIEGVKNPDKCKFPCEVNSVILPESIEILETTEAARLSIKGVPEWKM